MSAGEHVFEKEMGFSHSEIERLLPKAYGDSEIRFDGRVISVRNGSRLLRLQLSDEGERRLGNIRIPVTHVRMEFSGYPASEIEAALERFTRAFQKGGG